MLKLLERALYVGMQCKRGEIIPGGQVTLLPGVQKLCRKKNAVGMRVSRLLVTKREIFRRVPALFLVLCVVGLLLLF